jgi:hypothetical protein
MPVFLKIGAPMMPIGDLKSQFFENQGANDAYW